MSIAAANLFTRNIYKEYFNREATDRQESSVAKITSLVVKFGALLFIVYIPTQYVLNFQLLGGVWILQTLPAVFLGLFTRWFNRWAMLIGWAAGMIAGTGMFIATGLKSSIYPITIGNVTIPMYEAVSGVILNLVLVLILTPIFEAIGLKRGQDQTVTDDYDEETAPVEPVEVGREALG
jgi:SSS family solute:Na+ symporter